MGDQQEIFKQLTSGSFSDVLSGLTERERGDVTRLMAGNLNKVEADEMMHAIAAATREERRAWRRRIRIRPTNA